MSDAAIWFLAALVLVAVELFTGSFYLLMIALGLLAAAFAGLMGVGMFGQQTTAALVASLAVVALYFWRRSHHSPPREADQLDIGQNVNVESWSDEGTAEVVYRGTRWRAVALDTRHVESGVHHISAIKGNTLVLHK